MVCMHKRNGNNEPKNELSTHTHKQKKKERKKYTRIVDDLRSII